MTDTSHRLYAVVAAGVIFLVSWAAIAARPWPSATPDPRLAALALREQRLRADTVLVRQVVAARTAAYEAALTRPPGPNHSGERAGRAGRQGSRRAARRPRREPPAPDDHEDLVMLRRTFRAMGTDVELLLDAAPGERSEDALARGRDEVERLEQAMSRFREDSELSTLNRVGRLDPASPDLLRVVRLALAGRERTGGRFDPTVHDAVVAAGYDRSFELIANNDDPAARGRPRGTAHHACGGRVRVDGAAIELEAGTRLDLGGIGKGYTADRVAEHPRRSGALPRQHRRRPRRARRRLAGRRHRRPDPRALPRRHGDLRAATGATGDATGPRCTT